jgi:cob(I)alamin adenosyltransferase
MTKGLIHLYIGDGKGKTTASAGLSVRAAGRNKQVVFAQFLKSGGSGETGAMERLGIRVIRSSIRLGFTFQMNEEERKVCRAEQERILGRVREILAAEKIDLLVLDEALDAVNTRMLDEGEFRLFVENKPAELELVLTGRNPAEWMIAAADYVSEIKKIKHPFDRGFEARVGVEL